MSPWLHLASPTAERTFDTSSSWLMSPRRELPCRTIIFAAERTCAMSSCSMSSSWCPSPRMTVSGVRNSCVMFVKNISRVFCSCCAICCFCSRVCMWYHIRATKPTMSSSRAMAATRMVVFSECSSASCSCAISSSCCLLTRSYDSRWFCMFVSVWVFIRLSFSSVALT